MNLTTHYMGFRLRTPLAISSSPLCENPDRIREMVDAGASAVVLHSLFEEQLEIESRGLDRNLNAGTESYAESPTYFPDIDHFKLSREAYLEHIRKVKQAVDVPVFASLNGFSTGGWIEIARQMESAGADGLELNIYFLPTDPAALGNQVEQLTVQLVKDVASRVKIPVAVKVSPYFSATANIIRRLDQAGAKGVVIFNRFYQPDLDLENLEVLSDLTLSSPEELRLRLRWAAILFPHLEADIAITGGVHSAEDAIKAMMVGARVAMMTSAILKNGPGHFKTVLDHMTDWMEKHDYESVEQMQGSMSHTHVADPAAFERANYMKVLGSWREGSVTD